MLIRQTFLYLPAQIAGPLAQMVAAFAWTHFLAPEALGAYALIWSVQELAGLIVLSWWSSYVLRYASSHDGKDERARLDAMELFVHGLAALAQAVLALGGAVLLLETTLTVNLAAAILAFTLTRNVLSHYADRARAAFNAGAFTVLQGLGSALGFAFALAAVLWVAATSEALLWGYAAAQALSIMLALRLMPVQADSPKLDAVMARAALAYGAPLILANILSWAGSHVIRVAAQFELGAAAVGLVTVGWWLGLRITTFASLLVSAAGFPLAVERVRSGGAAAALPQFAANSALLLGILAPTVAGVALLNTQIVQTLVAAPFAETTIAVLPLAVAAGAVRGFKHHGSDQVFLLFERTQLNIWSMSFEALATVVLCWAGLWWGGLAGAAFGCLIAAAAALLVSLGLAIGRFGFFMHLRDLVSIAIATGVMSGFVTLLPAPSGWLALGLTAGAGAAVYGMAIALLYPGLSRALLKAFSARLFRPA